MAIVIIDYGLSNLGSIKRSLEECGGAVHVSDDPHDLKSADKIVLPGVGSFSDGMHNLAKGGWIGPLKDEVLNNHIPLLGICLGMQLLADTGYEGGTTQGLALISGEIRKMIPSETERIPHVGWNEIVQQRQSPLLSGIQEGANFYFVHSYHFLVKDQSHVVAQTPYAGGFNSVVEKDNIYGTQFHPEKSQILGFRVLKNFIHV
jgi:glutamine amidotransferase